jgi:peptide deformylase
MNRIRYRRHPIARPAAIAARDPMAPRPVVQYPDPRLRLATVAVTSFDDGLRRIVADLTDTLDALSAIGITAPHVGELARVYCLRLPDWPAPRIYVNARIAWQSADMAIHREGSVSTPGIVEEVERAARVRVDYHDLDGRPQVEDADGFHAACHQHEVDQLDGIFWLHRLSRLRRDRAVKRFQKIQRSL